MKKIFLNFILTVCLILAVVGVGGCSSCSSGNNSENGGQTEVDKIATLEGTWKSEEDKYGGYEKVVVEGNSIRCYINGGMNHSDVLYWAGVYIPLTEPVSEGEWTFNDDKEYYEHHINELEDGGYNSNPDPKTFYYKDKKLSCNMKTSIGDYEIIYFTKVSD